jgi:hypothetical protein
MLDISVLQQQAISGVFKTSEMLKDRQPPNADVLHVLSKHTDLLVEIAPEVGLSLKEFSAVADYSHPDIGEACGAINAESIHQYLEILKYASSAGYFHALSNLKKLVRRQISESKKLVNLHDNIRFISDPQQREIKRRRKGFRSISIKNMNQSVFDNEKKDFSIFVRLNDVLSIEIKKAEERGAKFSRLGYTEIQKEVLHSIEEFKKSINSDYYGFHRLSIRRAAIMLARLHDMEVLRPRERQGQSFIQFPKSLLNHYVFLDQVRFPFYYHPCVFPLWQVADKISEEVRAVVNYLDAFPEAGGRPIFDHFIFLVPGTEPPKSVKGFNYLGAQITSSTFPEALFRLNHSLLINRHVAAALMGEKDGRCYFICFF